VLVRHAQTLVLHGNGPTAGLVMAAPSHAPSGRLGACDGCANGDHAGCDVVAADQYEAVDCTCYDDAWEWHEALGRRAELGRPA
jgi:hypothetical protein